MRKSIIALILMFFAVFCAFGQNSDTIDLVLLLDTSSSMGSSFEKVNNYITGRFLSDFLRTGDTFHLISFSSSPRLDIARKISSRGDVETIIGRMLIQYPVETGNNVTAAVNYAEAYIATLPPRPKKIVVVSAAGPETSGIINSAKQRFSSKNATFDFVSVTEVIPGSPNLSNPPGSGRSSPRQTSSQQSAQSGTASTAGTGTTKPSGTASTQGTSGTQASQGASTQGTTQGTSSQGASQTGAQSVTAQGSSQTGTQSGTAQGTSQTGTQSGTAQGTSQTGTQSGTQSGTTQGSTGTGASQTGGQTTQGTGAQSSTNAQSATPGAQTAQSSSGDSPGTGSSAQGTSSQDKQASDKSRDSGQDAAAKGSPNDKGSSASDQNDSRSINPTLLLIIGIVAAVLLLILLIAFISRRLGSSPNRVMASVSSSGGKDDKFTDHSKDLASYAARQSKQRVTPYQDRPVKQQAGSQSAINPSGPLLLNLFVEDQSTSIGKRNIHSLKSGYSLSVGGGKSDDFHIFLVSMPPHIGDIRRNGSQLTFIPRKPKYFPDLGSNEVRDCINKRIRIVSDKNYEMWFRFVTYEDPLEALNRVLHSIKVPG